MRVTPSDSQEGSEFGMFVRAYFQAEVDATGRSATASRIVCQIENGLAFIATPSYIFPRFLLRPVGFVASFLSTSPNPLCLSAASAFFEPGARREVK